MKLNKNKPITCYDILIATKMNVKRSIMQNFFSCYRSFKISDYGICYAISRTLYMSGYSILATDLSKIIALLQPKYAIPFHGNSHNIYWWEIGKWGTGRMKFLNWLIKQYKYDHFDMRQQLKQVETIKIIEF